MKFLKLIVSATFVVVVLATSPNSEKNADKMTIKCLKEINGLKSLLSPDEWDKPENISKVKWFSFCFNKKMGYMNDAGEFQKDAIRKSLSDSHGQKTIDNLLKKCAVKKATPEETAYHYQKCSRKFV
ncbi:PBP GOBP domain containing protein [Asbolus verrucosus]|uniref:PBP GOBP domain containing protein n=1 Tax=Asbolus verrucosus TaxID=1661398 RepID=A0A482VZC8_ASBVE|nr:PBP GOBP domain containing protein [Asbolus verrucosus]